jgi:regulator of sigma E protease
MIGILGIVGALLPENIIPVALGVVALGIVVFIHELGHFVVAKLCGIRVEVFSIGFPPKIWGFRRGGTEYRLSWIFFGGYVKLAGMEFEDGVDPRGVKDGYYASPLWTKVAVCACGPAMNILTAFLLFSCLYVAGFPVPANMESTVIGSVVESSPAERAGLKHGDRVLAVNGRAVERWEEVNKSIVYSTTPAVEIAFSREGARRVERIVPERDEKLRLKRIGIYPVELISVDILKGSPAAAAGMRDGDFILNAQGGRVYSWEHLMKVIRGSGDREVRLGVLRKGESAAVTVSPRWNAELKAPAIGVRLRTAVGMDELEANGLVVYLYRDPFTWMARNIEEMYFTLKGLVLRAVSPRGLAGAIGIIQIMSYFMRAGLRQFVYIMAVISVNLGVLNLLPVPVLDGGHIMIALIESARRKPISARVMTAVQNVFVALLLTFMILVSANDVVRIWGESISRLIWKTTPVAKP